MGVIVPIGTQKSAVSGLTIRHMGGRVPDPPARATSGETETIGTKVPSTGPRITIKGTKWSPCHPYVRTGMENKILSSGYIRQARNVTYSGRTYRETEESFGCTGYPGYSVPKFSSPFCSYEGAPRAMTANESARLETELLLKAGKRQWSLGESIAESGQTLRLISHTASRLARTIIAIRRGRIAEIPQILGVRPKQLKSGGTFSSYWLEYSYGWLPLMNDLYDAHGVFQKGLSRPQLIRAVRRIKLGEYDMARNSSKPGDSIARYANVTGSSVLTAQAIAYYRLQDEYLTYFQQLGLINPLEVAWAVVPFSFVLDWFIPIQNTLEATTATVGMKFVDGSVTVKAETSAEATFRYAVGFSTPSSYTLEETSPHNAYRAFGMKRSVLKEPKAQFYTKSPFSTTHAISALALLRQLKR